MTSEKSYALEARLDTQVAEGWTLPFEVVKSADEGRGSTTMADDSELKLTGLPAGTYKVEADLLYSGGAGASEGDLKVDFAIPTGFLRLQGLIRLASDAGVLHQVSITAGAGFTAWTGGLAYDYGISLRGNLVTSASGTFVFRWAPSANTGTNSWIRQYSRLSVARRI